MQARTETFKYAFLPYINNILINRRKNMREGISEKELAFISVLELKKKYFFTLNEISSFFKNANERGVYVHRLRKKRRIIKLNRHKYFLVPIKAPNSNWSEHPFILIDEIMDGKNYCIVGTASANYWKLSEQIPQVFEVWNNRKHKIINIFNAIICFKKHKLSDLPKSEKRQIHGHSFIIASKEESRRWK
jgi:predicted transcriptional regulator of viral defense system